MAAVESGSLSITGVRQVIRALEQIGLEAEDLKAAFSHIAAEGAREIQGFVPVKSGRLRGDVRGNRAKSKAVVAAGRASVPYAGPRNYGWPARNIRPALFMQYGDAVMAPRALAELEAELNRQIRKRGLA